MYRNWELEQSSRTVYRSLSDCKQCRMCSCSCHSTCVLLAEVNIIRQTLSRCLVVIGALSLVDPGLQECVGQRVKILISINYL